MDAKEKIRVINDLSAIATKDIKITFNFHEYDRWEPDYNFCKVELPNGKTYNFPYFSRLHKWMMESNLYKKKYITFMKDLKNKVFRNLHPGGILGCKIKADFTILESTREAQPLVFPRYSVSGGIVKCHQNR